MHPAASKSFSQQDALEALALIQQDMKEAVEMLDGSREAANDLHNTTIAAVMTLVELLQRYFQQEGTSWQD